MAAEIIGGIASVVGGLLGKIFGGADRAKAQELLQKTLSEYEAMGIPPMEAQRLTLERFKSAGIFTPEMEQAILQGETNFKNIQIDPRLKSAQRNALASLESIADEGGMDLTDKANLERTLGESQDQARGGREAILASTRARGMSGSGLEMQAQLDNQQRSAQQGHQAALSVAGDARRRALAAIEGAGSMATSQRGQEFGEQAQIAGNQDAIDRFNTANRQDVSSANVASRNAGSKYNLEKNQGIMDKNTSLANDEQVHNKGLYQQEFSNKMAKEAAVGGARANVANGLTGSAAATEAAFSGVGSGVAKAAGAYGQQQAESDAADKRYARDEDFYKKYGKVRRS